MTFKEYIQQQLAEEYNLDAEEVETCISEIYSHYTLKTYIPDLEVNSDDYSQEIFEIEFEHVRQFLIQHLEISFKI